MQPDTENRPFVIVPPGGLICYVCAADTKADEAHHLEVRPFAEGFGIAVCICPSCIARAVDCDGDTTALFSDIRRSWLTEHRVERKPSGPNDLTLRRRPITTAGRRHPPYGRELLETPPHPGDTLTIAVDSWETFKLLPEPRMLMRLEDNISRQRFDVAKGRRVRVVHAASADGKRLAQIAQTLIDFGAQMVELYVHPTPPGHAGSCTLRFHPEAEE